MKQIQLAKMYKGDRFMGYGVAVDGELLSHQVNTNINTEPLQHPVIQVTFNISTEFADNPIRVDISPKK